MPLFEGPGVDARRQPSEEEVVLDLKVGIGALVDDGPGRPFVVDGHREVLLTDQHLQSVGLAIVHPLIAASINQGVMMTVTGTCRSGCLAGHVTALIPSIKPSA